MAGAMERERETGRIERDGRTPVATAASEGKGRRAVVAVTWD